MAPKSKIRPCDRLAWHAQVCQDLELSHVAVRVAVHIGAHFNNNTGSTFISYERIAKDLGLSRATVAVAIKKLRQRGHMDVRTRGGGRGLANVYGMILKTVQDSGRFDVVQTVQTQPENRPGCRTPTLTSPSEKNSARERARQDAFVFEDSSEAREWSDYLRGQGKCGTLMSVTHKGRRGAWMPSLRPPQSECPQNRSSDQRGLLDVHMGSQKSHQRAYDSQNRPGFRTV